MGPISDSIYSADIKLTDVQTKGGTQKRLKLDKIAESIAFKTEKEMKFYNKHHYVPLNAKDENGKLAKVYVNVNSLAKKTNLSTSQIRAESKLGLLESLIQSKGSGTDHALERITQQDRQKVFQDKLELIRGLDPALNQRRLDKMVKMLLELENREQEGRPYLQHLEETFQKNRQPLRVSKAKGDFPYSFEYHGKNAKGDPILLIKYDPNFASGAYRRATKGVDFYSARVLVKSKQVNFLNNVNETQNYRNMDGIKGALNLILVMNYDKNGKHVEAVYTDFKNRGDLVKVKKKIFGGLEAKLADIPRDQQKQILLVGMYHLLKTLEEIHAKGIVHRDVKANNILLHQDKEGKWEFFLGDPGFSSPIRNRDDYMRGTIFAPEQLSYDGVNYPNEKIDIYALGKTFQEIFLHQAKQKGHTPGDWESEELKSLFRSMQNQMVAKRYSATQAKNELHGILKRMGINPEMG